MTRIQVEDFAQALGAAVGLIAIRGSGPRVEVTAEERIPLRVIGPPPHAGDQLRAPKD